MDYIIALISLIVYMLLDFNTNWPTNWWYKQNKNGIIRLSLRGRVHSIDDFVRNFWRLFDNAIEFHRPQIEVGQE